MHRTSLITRTRSLGYAAALLLSLSVGLAQAQAPDDEVDPPDRAVRLSYIQGDVSLQPTGEEEWGTAVVNRPLTTGDKLWTDDNARVEMYVGPAAVRLSGDTGFSFLNVDDNTIQMRITAGVMDVRVRALDENDQIEIDTPNLALSLLRPGKYRVEVNDEGDTTVVKVSEGEAEASGSSQNVVVHAQQAATFRGTEQLAASFGTLGAPDAFDSWSLERDRRDQVAEAAPSSQYVSPDVVGYQDLDANGTWSSEPEYGYVWTPTTVAVGWSPYRYGRWVWVRPWGWTWIDDAPWGYAPSHYGRWAHVRERWCWVPGPRHVRPVYAPALVGWVGGSGVDVSISVGGGRGVAWFPLGPREVYVPAHRVSRRYVERVNVSNTVIVNKTYITNVYENRVTNIDYRNRRVPGAVTAVSRTTFTSAQPVGRHVVRIDEREITRMRSSGAAPRIEPGRDSVLSGRRGPGNGRTPPAAVVDRQVIVKREPPKNASRFVRAGGDDAARLNGNSARVNSGDRVDDTSMAERARAIRRDREAREQALNRDGAQAAAERQRAAERDQAAERERAGERQRAARDTAAARNTQEPQEPRDSQERSEERPAQGRVHGDRPFRANRPVIPDHVNRAPRDQQSGAADAAAADRAREEQQARDSRRLRDEQQSRDDQARQEQQARLDRDRQQVQLEGERRTRLDRDRQQMQDHERQAQAERDRQQLQERERQSQVERDRPQQEQSAQADRARQQAQIEQARQQQFNRERQMRGDRDRPSQMDSERQEQRDRQQQMAREQQQAQMDRMREAQADRDRQQAQQHQQRQQQQAQQQEQVERMRQAQADRDRQQAQQRDAQRSEVQRSRAERASPPPQQQQQSTQSQQPERGGRHRPEQNQDR